MSQGFGREVPALHIQTTHREITKYLIVIHGGEGPVARLCLSSHQQVAELDANTQEVTAMITGLVPNIGATGAEWDRSLAGHSAEVRAVAEVYTLSL